MAVYRDSAAAIRVGQFIRNRLAETDVSVADLANSLELPEGAKMVHLLMGRHYFPLELARATSDALELDGADLVYRILLQYEPVNAVDFVFEAIGRDALAKQKMESLGSSGDKSAKELKDETEGCLVKEKRKKRKKGKKTAATKKLKQ